MVDNITKFRDELKALIKERYVESTWFSILKL